MRKTSHKWFSSLIPVKVEERLGNAQFCVMLLSKESNRHQSLGGVLVWKVLTKVAKFPTGGFKIPTFFSSRSFYSISQVTNSNQLKVCQEF